MKRIAITIALFALTATTVKAQGKPSASNDNVVLSFQVGNPQASNAKLIIRNSEGQVVKVKSITTNYCNVDKSIFGSGAYNFTIVNGRKSCTGSFSVK